MSKTHRCRLGPISLRIVEGDLFEIGAEAIVNSEQTDFVLSPEPGTISGQILREYGSDVQQDLYAQTEAEVLPRGSVLFTKVGAPIYHAGFHEPQQWLTTADEDEQTEYVSAARECVRSILSRLSDDGMTSVAFPLIGTGLFGLSKDLLLREFAQEVVEAAASDRVRAETEVSLVVRQVEDHHAAVEALSQALADRAVPPQPELGLSLGVTYLDRFVEKRVWSNHPQWFGWMLCRYAELAGSYVCGHLASASGGRVTPLTLLQQLSRSSRRPSLPLCFGHLRDAADRLLKELGPEFFEGTWTRFFAELIARDREKGNQRLLAINADRNAIAHGRQARTPSEILRDLEGFLRPGQWRELAESAGAPPIVTPDHWLASSPGEGDAVGVLETITPKKWRYLVPVTGETFKLDCPAAGPGD